MHVDNPQKRQPLPNGRFRARQSRVRFAAAFTLVELLIVLALSALLLALLFGPIVQGFRLTNKARAIGAAQDASRFGLEQLTRELRQASYVFDNTNTPVALPLEEPDAAATPAQFGLKAVGNLVRKNTYQTGTSGKAIVVPLESFAKIDFVPSALRTDITDANNPQDPTTGRPVNGGQLRLPVAPGTRFVRYWVGLRRNYTTDTTGAIKRAYYDNVYEFPRTDDSLNPFVLWRAEYDPTDPNLVNQRLSASQQYTVDLGGVNDPDFFYNLNTAANGKSYAENWRAVSSPIVSGTNLDLLAWRRNAQRQIDTQSPFQTGVSLAPGTIVGDTATPGYLTGSQSESPSSVPSLYTTQYGQWTLPFTLTVYRSSSQFQGGTTDPRGLYGSASFRFASNNGILQVTQVGTSLGTLTYNPSNDFYWMRSVSTGKYFLKTPNLAFIVDPARGRIEAGLPPLAANNTGAPQFYNANAGNALQAMSPGTSGNEGEIAETVFMESTLHPSAGQQGTGSGSGQYVPLNQGILYADLAALSTQPVNGVIDSGNYYTLTDTAATTPILSPFVTFGGAVATNTSALGAQIVPGSERVTGPDNLTYEVNAGGVDPNINTPAGVTGAVSTADIIYSRVPSGPTTLLRERSVVTTPANGPQGVYVRRGNVTYKLIQDLKDYNRPYLLFDEAGGFYNDPRTQEILSPDTLIQLKLPAGLPAGFLNQPNTDRRIKVTYLWQNNYARDTEGRPTDASGQTQLTKANAPPQAEPDVMKVDYSTRTLLNVALAVRVYDSSSGQPQTSQVTDKIRVSNIGR